MSRRRQQTAPSSTGWEQDSPGVLRRTRGESSTRNRRDPPRRPTSGEGGNHKPKAKGTRGERESEGLVVPRKAKAKTSPEGRGPTLVAPSVEGKREGMAARPNHPAGRKAGEKVRELRRGLFVAAKRSPGRRL